MIPSVDKLIHSAVVQKIMQRSSKRIVLTEIRGFLDDLRATLSQSDSDDVPNQQEIETALILRIEKKLENSLRCGINGVGIILHTNMGRAPFAHEAQQQLMDTVSNYCTLELDLDGGKRGHRDNHVEELICEITGAEAATVVNNNAAATMIVLNTLAKNHEVIVSRGELVEIGGAFRIPDIMEQSGAILREVGTTNRTHLKDYLGAIVPEQTAMLMHVHKSNYYISGFTKEVPLEEIAQAAHAKGLPFYDDLGSGALIDLSRYGLSHEPTVQESLKAGADVVSFSGDKLLGGPQAGIIVGKKEIIDRIRKSQLMRVMRCDKMRYAVLEATLKLFLDEENLPTRHPILKMLTEPADEVKTRATILKRRLKAGHGTALTVSVVQEQSQVGSGSLSWEMIPTWCTSIQSKTLTPNQLSSGLRKASPPVMTRIKNDAVLIDLRTVQHSEIGLILKAFEQTLGSTPSDEDFEDEID